MIKKYTDIVLRELPKAFKGHDSRFILSVGLKVTGISFLVSSLVYLYLYQVMRLNYILFKAAGFTAHQDGSVFFDYLAQEVISNLTMLFIYHIFLFFLGTYVGWLILRPFRLLGDYSEQVIENPNSIYRVDEFSTYKLLTRFSEFFFEYLREARRKGAIVSNSIPPQFSRIHQPVLDWIFMLHFGILLVIISITSSVFIIENSTSIYNNMTELAATTFQDTGGLGRRFFTEQLFILDDMIVLTIILLALGYLGLGLHLYGKVSGAAFAIFSTMRSFMKGNYSSRVHLIGYAYLREHTRKLNKYLEYAQNNFTRNSSSS
jgi:hypothetical protein